MLITTRKDSTEFVKILDFGIAKLQVEQKQTATGMVLGTPLYMPPEQWEGKDDVDGRVDIYALGMILYESLTGTYPFEAKSAMQLMYAHASKEVPDPGERVQLPERLRRLVLDMVKKRPEDRPASMSVVEAELTQVIIELGGTLRVLGPESSSPWTPIASGSPRPLARTADPVLSFTAEPSMTGVGPLADSFVARGAASLSAERPVASRAGASQPELAGTPAKAAGIASSAIKPRRRFPLMVAGVSILAIGAAAAVGLNVPRGASRPRATGTLEQLPGVAPVVVEKRSPAPRLVELGPGRLLVGRPGANLIDGPAYAVDVGHFFIEAYEVSAAQWAEYVQATKQSELPTDPTAGNLPAVGISRAQAMKYCNWRHRGGRLPTEAEWEYAARDGHNDHLYPWSTAATTGADGPAVATRSGQPRANLGSLRPQLAAVDSYPLGSSAHGVYNLLGNAAEWTLSDSTLYPGSRAAVPSGMAVVRGGSALTPPQNLFATTRQFVPPTRTDPFIGFRCWTGER